MRPSKGGGNVNKRSERTVNVSDIALPKEYKIEAVSTRLTFPSGICFDDSGDTYVIEAGYSYGEEWTEPRLLKIEKNGKSSLIAKGGKNGPWNGLTFHDGSFYVAEGGELNGGKILRISKDGTIRTIVENLPSYGDHHTNGPLIIGNYIYFGQGTATNSSVVGNENAKFGWLKRKKDFHDIPCRDITLTGINYETENVLTDGVKDKATTGSYLPYGTPSKPNQVIKGSIPCSGSILRVPLAGGPVELVAWGLRNPFGLAASPTGKIFVTENAFDERGSRPVWGAGDVLWEVEEGKWYGWPDFSAGKPIINDEEFKSPRNKRVKPVLASYPNQPPKPAAIFAVHSSASGVAFSTSDSFGFKGEAFVAEFGDMAAEVGKVLAPVGFKISKVNVETGVVDDFAVNKGKRNGPASKLKHGGLERPVAVKFNRDGNEMYIVDFGVLTTSKKSSKPYKETGVIWKITRK